MAIAYESLLESGGSQLDSLTVTSMPTTTSYSQGDTLDTTGLVVTAVAGRLSGNVTSHCTITPTVLNTIGTQTITVAYGGLTTTFNVTVTAAVHIYGAEWDGSSNPAWTRTDDAANFSDPQPYYSGMSGTPSSPFDNLMPWSGMQIVEDVDAGTLVSIPKFWYKWTRTGSSMKLQISDGEQTGTGWHVSPAHANRGDGVGERDVVYISRYKCADTTYKSTSGVLPQVSQTRASFRSSIHNLGSTIWQNDFAMWWTIRMLYLVEFANWNSQAMIGGGGSEGESTSSGIYNMGTTDNMPYHTGTVASSIGATVYGANQYRYIENLWGNVYDMFDGLYIITDDDNETCEYYCINNPSYFSDNSNGTLIGSLPYEDGGTIKVWSEPIISNYEYTLFPVNFAAISSTKYICDEGSTEFWSNNWYTGEYYAQRGSYGLFHLDNANNPNLANTGSRLMKLPS